MARQNEAQRRERQEEMLRWRWAFTRDGVEYQKAYKKALQLREQSGVSLTTTYLLTEQGRQERALAEDFRLFGKCMIDPEMSFEDLTESKGKAKVFEKQNFRPLTFYDHFTAVKLDIAKKELNIKIDLSKVNSFEALPNEIKRLVDFELNHKARPFKERKYFEPGGQHSKGKDFYDILLTGRTYREMQTQQEKRVTFLQLAQKLNPRKFEKSKNEDDGVESLRRKAEKSHNEYERLVNGAYREITYP